MKPFTTTCIMCPLGCQLNVTQENKSIIVSGNTCPRGNAYINSELTNPVRSVSSLVRVGEKVVPVKTTAPITKNKINDVLNELSKIKLNSMPPFGTIIIKNVLNLSVDVVSIGF